MDFKHPQVVRIGPQIVRVSSFASHNWSTLVRLQIDPPKTGRPLFFAAGRDFQKTRLGFIHLLSWGVGCVSAGLGSIFLRVDYNFFRPLGLESLEAPALVFGS